MVIYGINPTLEALRAGRVTEIQVSARRDRRIAGVLRLATERGAAVREVPPEVLDRAAHGRVHQGVVAHVAAAQSHTIDELLRVAGRPPLVVVLDGIQDPQNFGAILRVADAAGADGVVHQTRRAAPPGPAAAKASAGALAHVRLVPVVNIRRALDELKAAGLWTVGLAPEGAQSLYATDLAGPTAVVLGAEQTGLRRLVREGCDWLVAIPMRGRVASLNVAVAAGVVLFEAVRQRAVAAGAAR